MNRFYSKEIPNLIIMMVIATVTSVCFLESWREEFALYVIIILILLWAIIVGLSYEVNENKIVFYKFNYRYISILFEDVEFLTFFGRTFSIMTYLNRPVILLGLKRTDVNLILNKVNKSCGGFNNEEFFVILNNAKLLRGVVQDVGILSFIMYLLFFVINPSVEVGFIVTCFFWVSFSVSLILKLKGIKKL
ncbi:hypothetical protein N473_07365 [Pseudoalteromonas luteoviolacea CPMOR-1]|uniref:Uncharacterized protein n=1 Tax=Pseudoalteromonas luteoviolacea CPMOR-1 TaxID=1365248 RepID=A0A167NGQ3_9GAMM|nr:hypothetical protein [Pseudoalteromonas luteoviolacea]KZN68236.1 hypothetical protein N473_07365 [Pseudoalteromonas luteoviolacea CPMOR-1]